MPGSVPNVKLGCRCCNDQDSASQNLAAKPRQATVLSGNQHAHLDGLVRFHCERVGLRFEIFLQAILHIENVGPGRQRNTVRSVSVRRDPGNFSSSILTQDDERIRLIISRRSIGGTWIRKLGSNFLDRKYFQTSLYETRRLSFDGVGASQYQK